MTKEAKSALKPSRRSDAVVLCISAVLLSVVSGGCAPAERAFVPTQNPDEMSTMAFLHYLPTVPVANVDEGCRGMLILAGDDQLAGSFEARRDLLVERGLIRGGWPLEANSILDRGTLAYMLSRSSDLQKSLCERLCEPTGWGSRRYALRSCQHMGILIGGLSYEPVTGAELLSAISRTEDAVDP